MNDEEYTNTKTCLIIQDVNERHRGNVSRKVLKIYPQSSELLDTYHTSEVATESRFVRSFVRSWLDTQ